MPKVCQGHKMWPKKPIMPNYAHIYLAAIMFKITPV